MGLDLTLLPFDADFDGLAFSHTMLPIDRFYEAFAPIQEAEAATGVRVPERFQSFRSRNADGDSCYGVTVTTPYGEPLRCIRADDLLRALSLIPIDQDADRKTAAAIDYLKRLEGSTRVALFWH